MSKGPQHMPKWTVYCRYVALGGSKDARAAKLAITIGGRSAKDCRARLEQQLAAGTIDGESYRVRTDAVDTIEHMRDTGAQYKIDRCPLSGGWLPCGSGHVRNMARVDQ